MVLLPLVLALCNLPSWTAPAVRQGATLKFSGYTWQVIQSAAPRGPGPNIFSRANVRLDERGRLVLETSRAAGSWTSAHVFLTKSLGYGRYELVLAPLEKPLDDLTVFGFFTWDDNPAYANREIDIELARWALPKAPNLNFTVQPSADRPDRSGLAELFQCRVRYRFFLLGVSRSGNPPAGAVRRATQRQGAGGAQPLAVPGTCA